MKLPYKEILKSNTVKNGIWLYILQFFNTVFPLLTLPYVTRILGTNGYGIFSYALNIITYLQVIVEYGFNLSGAREIAIQENEKEREKIYSRIVTSKLLLLCITIILTIVIIIVCNFSYEQTLTIMIMFLIVIGTAFTQTWLFQGKQKMKFVTISNSVIRIIFMLLIFLFVKEKEDLFIYSFLYAIVFLVIGIAQTVIIKKFLNYKYKICNFKECCKELKNGWYTFTTSAMSKVFTGISVTILGIINGSDASVVGIYSAIQKIPLAINMVYTPVGQAIFPYISKKYGTDYKFSMKLIKKLIKLVFLCMIIAIIVVLFFSYDIIKIAFGIEYTQYHLILIPLIIWAFLGILNNLLGVQILVAQGKNKEYSEAFIISCISIVVLNSIFGMLWNIYGVSIATMLSELILSISLIKKIFLKKKKEEV